MDEQGANRNPILDVITQTRVAMGQLKLYAASSPQAQKAVGPAHAAVASFPGGAGRITVARTMRGLLVNGKRPPSGEGSAVAEKAWLQSLQDAQVNSLVILTSVGEEELSSFLEGLGRRFWDLKDGKAINARLNERGVLNAWVEEVEFVAMAKGDLLIEGATKKLEAAGARVAEIVQTMEQVIDGTSAEGLAEQVRLEIMRKLLEQDPQLIQKAQSANAALEAEGGGPGDGRGSGGGAGETGAADLERPSGVRRVLYGTGRSPGWIPFDRARKSLGEIARLLRQADPAQRETLRTLGHMILGGFRYDPLLRELLKKFLEDECIDLMPAWMKEEADKKAPAGKSKPSSDPTRRAAEILAMPEETRIEALVTEGAALLKELVKLKLAGLTNDLVRTAVEHARHVSPGHRRKAVKLLGELYALLEEDAWKDARAAIEERAVAALGLERDRTVFPLLADLAVLAVETAIRSGVLDAAVPLLEALRKQQQVDDKEYRERPEIAGRGLEKLASGPMFEAILEKLRAKQAAAVRTAEALGVAAARGLVERMRASDSMAERMNLAQIVLRAGSEAWSYMTNELQRVHAPSEALKLVDLLRIAMPEPQAEAALGTTLRHPALAVRRRAAAYLRAGGSSRAGTYFMEALRTESEASARALFAESLGALHYDNALTLLAQMMEGRGEPDEVRVAAAQALGSLGKPHAIPILSKAAVKGRGLGLVFGAPSTPVRAAATDALAAYTHHPECRETLRRLMGDSEASVRNAAGESLRTPLTKTFGMAAAKAGLVLEPGKLEGFQVEGITGYLADVPLDQICQVMEEETRTGLLTLEVGGMKARVYLQKGRVVSAEYDRYRGQDAFNQFCRWEGSHFLFEPGAQAKSPSAPQSLIKMLMDACEVRDRSSLPRA